jgi:hypothetical protein
VPFVNDQQQPNFMQWKAHYWEVFNMQFQEHTSRETYENLPFSPNKVAFIIDGSHTKLRLSQHMHGEWVLWSFRKITALEREIKRYFALHVRCRSLLTDRNQSYLGFVKWVESEKEKISRNSLHWKHR